MHRGHRNAHLVGKTACTKLALHPEAMCKAVVKAGAVIKKSLEESLLMSVEREDMCEDDAMWDDIVGKEDQDYL